MPENPNELPPSTLFEGIGVAVLNTTLTHAEENTQIFFKSSPWGGFLHGYNANNSFMINYKNHPLFLSARVWDGWATSHHNNWTRQSKSENVILVNGVGPIHQRSTSLGELWYFKKDWAE